MKTLGIDLAAAPKETAVCEIDWAGRRPRVAGPAIGRTDDELLKAMAAHGVVVGIDAPFGWPAAFVHAVATHTDLRRRWPMRGQLDDFKEELRLRATDRVVKQEARLSPLSVAADRIGVTAFRCALLLDRMQHERGWSIDRSGLGGKVVEVYPAAALKQWHLPFRKYKDRKPSAREERKRILDGLEPALELDLRKARADCLKSDHALDSLIAAIVVRAARLGWTRQPKSALERKAARREGWIHFPAHANAEESKNDGWGAALTPQILRQSRRTGQRRR